MPGPSRSCVLVLSFGAALLACSSSAPPIQSCATEAECPPFSRCLSSACVANAPPAPSIALPPDPKANVILSFDGSESADPDDGDSVVSHAWTFRALAAACVPPVAAGTGPLANVRFGCPGRYAVDLTAADEMGAISTATVEFDVAAYAGPTLLFVSEDVVRDHVCTSEPVRCAPVGDVALSASTPELSPEEVSFRWTVEPPADRPLGANRRVLFAPSDAVASPTVTVETDGQAISGDWTFHVEARDAAGVLGTGEVRLSVGNRLPVVTETIPTFQHVFDAAGQRFDVVASIPVEITDPDGDALVGRTVSVHHTGDGGARFEALALPDAVAVAIEVPYATPSDAAFLIGGAGLERSITFSISDVNGATVTEVWPVVVANRPPVASAAPALVQVDHAYDAATSRYVANATLSSWIDPDGDPLAAGPTGDPICPTLAVVEGEVRVACSKPFTGTPAVAQFAGARAITQLVADPWVAAAPVTTTLQIWNRSPRTTITSIGPTNLCDTGACCEIDTETQRCLGILWQAAEASFTVTDFAVDDDGDPFEVLLPPVATPSLFVCLTPSCAFDVHSGGNSGCGFPVPRELSVRLRDGGPEAVGTFEYSCK